VYDAAALIKVKKDDIDTLVKLKNVLSNLYFSVIDEVITTRHRTAALE